MVKIGMMLGERYEILEKIGTGGMSDVYKAKCHKLNRFVAVKVLKQEFAENENFVSKFRIEAQAAAGLMHPNIVNVYDVGEDGEIHYIVMELVEGITLKKYIERKAGLSYKEAVSIAIQVCMGIDSAHKNHIIHRDIKPQNIIISKDGKVKVTDFGIAKAATSNTISSNVMGSVHYTSPEQARGGYSDEKSDVYSLGVSLFEMLTGRVPFNGDTTVAIAIKHIQEPMPHPSDYNSDIPISVEAIVMKCCQKSPDKRYQSMQEVIDDLKQSMMTPDENFVVMHDEQTEGATRMMTSNELKEVKQKTSGAPEDTMRLNIPDTDDEGEDPSVIEEIYEIKKERIATILAVVFGIVICIIIIVLVGKILENMTLDDIGNKIDNPVIESSELVPSSSEESSEVEPTPIATFPMIKVEGMNSAEAIDDLEAMGLIVEVNSIASDNYEEGIVISCDIPEGTMVSKGQNVSLTVSTGVGLVDVLNVVGQSYQDGSARLIAQGFNVKRQESNSSEIPSGVIMAQLPIGGQSLKKGETVVITVSIGLASNQVIMPNLIGKTEMDATVLLAEYGLSLNGSNTKYVYNNEVGSGLVCYQSVPVGTAMNRGDEVDIAISMGPETGTYKCNVIIDAPTVEEAPEYILGSQAHIVLTSDDGKVLLDMNTSTFPQTANFYGIASSGGTISISYKVATPGETMTDPATGEIITVPGGEVTKTFIRRLEFVKE